MINWIKIEPKSIRKLSVRFDEFGNPTDDFMKVGRLLKYEGGGVELIGSINSNGGGCDCCGSDDIVIAYIDLDIPNE